MWQSNSEFQKGQGLQLNNSMSLGSNYNAASGVGYGTPVADVRVTGGISGSNTNGESYSDCTMVDLNGDGRLDAVYKKTDWQETGTNLLYCAINNGEGFDDPVQLNFQSAYEMEYETSSGSTLGFNVYVGGGFLLDEFSVNAGASYSQVKQTSSSDKYSTFMDMDRDGYTDIILSNENYYLHNNGNLTFSAKKLASDVVVRNVKRSVSNEEKAEYDENYFMQPPFRAWKAPYDGIISVKENAVGIGTDFSGNVQAETHIPDGNGHQKITMNVPGNMEKKGINIARGDNIYFITNAGSEIKNKDVEWNIDIQYEKVCVFDKDYEPVIFFPELINQEKITCEKSQESENSNDEETKSSLSNAADDDAKDELVRNLKNEGEECLLKLYDVESSVSVFQKSKEKKDEVDKYVYTATASTNYDFNRIKQLTKQEQKQIYEFLVESGFFLPRVFTKEQFNSYLAFLEKKGSALAESEKSEFFEHFAKQIKYDVTTETYRISDFKDHEVN